MRSLRCFAALVPSILAFSYGGAQAPSAATPAPATTVLHATSKLVLVDVVATEHGDAVHGLEQKRFHLFEDGREQAITSFDEHGPAAGPALAARPAALPPHVYSNVPVYAASSAVNVLLLDGLNTPMADQMEVRRQMIQYLGKIPPGTPLAIFTLASRLRLVEGFTTETAELVKAVQSAKGKAQASVALDPQNDRFLDSTNLDIANTPWMSPDAVPAMLQFKADLTAYQADQRVRMTVEAMKQLARYLSVIPGRKNLIWFSGSFPIALDPDSLLQSPFQAMRNYSEQMKEAGELLSASRVAVYPVDARGLLSMPSYGADYSATAPNMSSGTRTQGLKNVAAGPPPGPQRDNKNFLRELQTSQAGMLQLAGETGGQAYINTNGLKEAVAHALENGSSYYTLGYTPTGKEFHGEYRKLQVRMDGGDFQLAYRQGYYAEPAEKPSANQPATDSPMTAALLHGAPPSTQILFQTRVLAATDPLLDGAPLQKGPAGEMAATLKAPVQLYVVDLIVDARELAFAELPDGEHQTKIELALVAYDAEGNRVNYLDRSFDLKIKPEQFARTVANGIRMRMALDLPTGRSSLRIAVYDMGTARTGSLELPLTVAAK